MPRKGPPSRRPIIPDAKFGDRMVSQVVNKVMWDGKKTTAEAIVYDAMELAAKRLGSEPLAALHNALEAVRPSVEVKSRRVGGATYQVPVEVSERRRGSLAMSTPCRSAVAPSRSARIRIAWRRPTRHLPITAGNSIGFCSFTR